MDTHQVCTSPKMTDTELIRAVYRGSLSRDSALKRLARAMNAPLDTARAWLYRRVPASRRREIAQALDRELDQQLADLALLKARIANLLEDIDRVAADNREPSALASATSDITGAAPGGEGRAAHPVGLSNKALAARHSV